MQWLRSVSWITAAGATLVLATVAMFALQYRLGLPPLTLVVAVHGTASTASAQYAVLDGVPFIHVRLPSDAQSVIVSDLWAPTRAEIENEASQHGVCPYWSNDIVGNFLCNLQLLTQRWLSELWVDYLRSSGQPNPDDPFPGGPPADRNNVATCLFNLLGRYRFDFRLPEAGTVAHDRTATGDELTLLDIRNGVTSGTFLVDLRDMKSPDLWCRLRTGATRHSLAARSVEILNGLDVSAEGAAPLFVEPPLVEPQLGGEAETIALITTTANPSSLVTNSVLSPGSAMLISWTDSEAAGYRDLLLLVIGALYGLSMAMALEAVRPYVARAVTPPPPA